MRSKRWKLSATIKGPSQNNLYRLHLRFIPLAAFHLLGIASQAILSSESFARAANRHANQRLSFWTDPNPNSRFFFSKFIEFIVWVIVLVDGGIDPEGAVVGIAIDVDATHLIPFVGHGEFGCFGPGTKTL